MATRIGINGFGQIGRLALRAAWGWPEVKVLRGAWHSAWDAHDAPRYDQYANVD